MGKARAKFYVASKTISGGYTYPGQTTPSPTMQTVVLTPVMSGSEENKRFFSATPSGRIEVGLLNAEAAEVFQFGKECYVDFIFPDDEE